MKRGPGWLMEWGGAILRPIVYLGNNRVSQLGLVLTTTSAITILTFYTTEFFGVHVSPYAGIIVFLILPCFFVAGLLVIPLGIWLRFRHERAGGQLPVAYPIIDLRDLRLRETLLFVVTMTGVNLALFLAVAYRGVHYMDSVQFCGLTCHSVMQPEYTAYLNSPHARVACVECHIGPGAPWFVRSKLSGSWQVVSVTLDLYPRPIPTPIQNLRPSRETCEQCHWPLKFHGDKVVVNSHFAEDESNTATKTVLLMHTGGIDPRTRVPQGIHGVHLQPGVAIEYIATDDKHQQIPYVRLQEPNGAVREYVADELRGNLDKFRTAPRRLMDCMDCHNRPTHTFEIPAAALDHALEAKQVDPRLPWIKKKGLELLQAPYRSQAEAAHQIRTGLQEFYRTQYPTPLQSPQQAAIEQAADTLVRLFEHNVFPQMKVSWGTYPNNLGHESYPGCFRCHEGTHSTPEGSRVIPSDCDSCHNLLAVEEANPEVLKMLSWH